MALLLVLAACGGGPPEIKDVQDLADALAEEGFEKCNEISDNGNNTAVCVGEGAERFFLYVSTEGGVRMIVQSLRSGGTGGAISTGDNWVVLVYDVELGREISEALDGDFTCAIGSAVKTC